jgi:hypothetical protein
MIPMLESTSLINPFTIKLDLAALTMDQLDAHNIRNASGMRGYYKDGAALERIISNGNDPLHYETYEKHVP